MSQAEPSPSAQTGTPAAAGATAVAVHPTAKPPAWPRVLHAEDREFLPMVLEILDAPPSPVAITFIWLICAVFAAAFAWAYFGQLDVYAVAAGKIQVAGRSKVVQPSEPGKVVEVLVQNGDLVREGDPLLKLDATDTAADQARLTEDIMAVDAEVSRRRAAIAAAGQPQSTPPPIEFKPGTKDYVRLREQGVLAADLAQLAASLQTLEAQAAQYHAAEQRLEASIAERSKLLALSGERVKMRQDLDKMGSGSRAQVIDALTQHETELTQQVSEQGQLKETLANIKVVERKIAEATAQFVAEQHQKLAEAERKRTELAQDLIKASSKNTRMVITAPASGNIEQLAVTTVGQTVTTGQVLMTIVPHDAPLEIQALVLNRDIGFVHSGQAAVIKVDAFPFTRYGTVDGHVTTVSADAIDMRDAPNLSDAPAAVKPQGAVANSAASTPILVFPATVQLDKHSIDVDGKQMQLRPGMTVSVEIKTDKRRIIDYVLSPLREMASSTGHER